MICKVSYVLDLMMIISELLESPHQARIFSCKLEVIALQTGVVI